MFHWRWAWSYTKDVQFKYLTLSCYLFYCIRALHNCSSVKKMRSILSTILFVNISQEWMPMQWIIICTYAFSIGPNGALYVIIICSSFEYHNRTMYSKLKLKSFHSHSFNVFLFRFLPTTFACFYGMHSICIFNKDVQWYGWHTVRLLLIVQEVLLIFSTLFDIANTIKSRTLATSSL